MRCIFATKLEVFLAATKYFIFLPLKEVFNKKIKFCGRSGVMGVMLHPLEYMYIKILFIKPGKFRPESLLHME